MVGWRKLAGNETNVRAFSVATVTQDIGDLVADVNRALDKLEAFASFNGADFYGLLRNKTKLTLENVTTRVPESFPYGSGALVPLRAGGSLAWRVVQV